MSESLSGYRLSVHPNYSKHDVDNNYTIDIVGREGADYATLWIDNKRHNILVSELEEAIKILKAGGIDVTS